MSSEIQNPGPKPPQSIETQNNAKNGYFFSLTPERVLEAVETSGLRCSGRCMALNSFENRVYDVELETDDEAPVKNLSAHRRVVKFYRPGRWSRQQILEEHAFLADLVADEIPAVAPASFPDGQTLHQIIGAPGEAIYYALFPKVGGRAPDELSFDQLLRIGRLLARIHNVGAAGKAEHRVRLEPKTYGLDNLEFLLLHKWIPIEYEERYKNVVEKICEISEPWFQASAYQRIHGDCHLGNLLWNDSGSFFLDFDDMVQGPPVQDLWLLVPGRDSEALQQREALLEGYEQIRQFDRKSLKLIEPLRALRFVHYAAWIARRWADPAFPAAFPQFGSHRYWSDEVEDLERQLAILVDY